jgi:protein-tyrosine-phosphatase
MAADWLAHPAGDRVEVRSAGSAPADGKPVEVVRRVRDEIRTHIEELLADLEVPIPG